MKKTTTTLSLHLLVVVTLTSQAPAALVTKESFSYPDGPLTSVSAGVWSTHSGTAGQVDVVSGKVNLTQGESEDVNTALADGPYRGPTLYASFVVNYSSLPSRNGSFFAHFGTSSFRARVFATTNGAAAGKYRVGIANATTATPETIVPRDLDTNADYMLVVRYHTGAPASTLWINPASEGSMVDRVDATDSASATEISAFALRQSLSSGDGMGMLTLDDLQIGTAFDDVVGERDPTKNPPIISVLPAQTIPANAATPAIPFTVSDGETAANALVLTGSSSNPLLVADGGVSFGGGNSNRNVTVTPLASQQGSALITLTVTDGDNNTATSSFLVVVGAPGISPIVDQTMQMNTATLAVPVTVSDAESDVLTLSAVSTNEALLPSGNITFEGAGPNRSVMVAPVANVSGLTRVTVFVTDGFNSASNSFVLTVFPPGGIAFADAFDYADGSVTTNSFFIWRTHSAGVGQTGQTQVVEGKMLLNGAQGEDIHALLTNSPYAPSQGWILYTRLTLNFESRPTSGAAEYFAHFRNTGNSFGSRVFAITNGAAAGKLRLGVANSFGSPSAILPVDLETNRPYAVVTRFNVGTGQTTLWLEPSSEKDPGVTATDSPTLFEVSSYAFRQSGGMAALAVDDLKIGTSFAETVSSLAPRLAITRTGLAVEVSWATNSVDFLLQSSPDPSDPALWRDVAEPPSLIDDRYVLPIPAPTGNAFFRLEKQP